MTNSSYDERHGLDPIALFDLLRRKTVSVAAITAVFILAAVVYLQVTPEIYFIRAPYEINTVSIAIDELCEGDVDCVEDKFEKKIGSLMGEGWAKMTKNNMFSRKTTNPSSLEEYDSYLEGIESRISTDFLNEATAELAIIEADFGDDFADTNVVADAMLRTKRIIASINAGQPAVTFSGVSIEKAYPRPLFLILTAAFTGLTLGVVFVILRDGFQRWRH